MKVFRIILLNVFLCAYMAFPGVAQDSLKVIFNDQAIYRGNTKLFSCTRDRRDAITEFYAVTIAGKEQLNVLMLKSGTVFQMVANFSTLGKTYRCYIPEADIAGLIKNYLDAGVLSDKGLANADKLEVYCASNGFRLKDIPPQRTSDESENALPLRNQDK